jgi:tetratricopeptide (TPR) repeat protein
MIITWKACLACSILVIAIALAAPVASPVDPVTIYTQQADEFFRNGRLEQALAEYEKVLKLDPNNVYALHQVKTIRQKLGLEVPPDQETAPETPSSDEKKYPTLPPRDYSRIYPRLGQVFRDERHNFSIQPPQGWWIDKYDPHFAVKFTDPGYEAFIFINIIKLEGPVAIDANFRQFVKEKNRQVETELVGYHAVYQNTILFKGKAAFEVRATYVAGANLVRFTTYYIPSGNKVFMITTVCTDELQDVWNPLFNASFATFKPYESAEASGG